ncbi:MAG TPA: hypothetical protein VLN57_21340 [Xanthobacteraceae bacterium]|nr:hypothetical protein [Xanthobacteraceae bacterium]
MAEEAPYRRAWLWSPNDDRLEIFLFGMIEEIAVMFAAIKSTAEHWNGFAMVQIISSGPTAAGLSLTMNSFATYDDPIAEALLMFRSTAPLRSITWAMPFARGTVGEW